jgi:uncharacterized membrane protein
MKPLQLLGVLLLAIGAVIVLQALTTGTRSVIRVGDLQASAETRRSVPTWVGAFVIVGGALLIGTGLHRRSHGA